MATGGLLTGRALLASAAKVAVAHGTITMPCTIAMRATHLRVDLVAVVVVTASYRALLGGDKGGAGTRLGLLTVERLQVRLAGDQPANWKN